MTSLSKMFSAMALSFVAVTSIVSADGFDHSYAPVYGNQYSSSPFVSHDMSYGSNSCAPVCAPQCAPASCNTNDFFFDIDFLYLNAAEHGLTYGSETNVVTNVAGTSEYHIKKKNPHHKWDAGFRLGLGYHFACECYDAAVYWTHFDTDAHGHHDKLSTTSDFFTPSFGAVAPLLGNAATPVDSASAHWKLRLNLIDVEIGRSFCVNSCLSIRPYIGARGAIIDQRYDLRYEARNIPTELTVNDETHVKSDFNGGGIRLGTDVEYNLGCGVSLFGDLAGSLLYGETEIKTREAYTTTTAAGVTATTFIHQHDNDRGLQAITDATIGVRWQQCCCNKVITLELGWEQHYFFSQNQFEKFTNFNGTDNANTDRYPQYNRGDLSIQGLVVSAKLQF